MDIRIQSIHFDASEQLQAFIQKKVSKLEKYYEDIKKVEVSLTPEQTTSQKILVLIILSLHSTISKLWLPSPKQTESR